MTCALGVWRKPSVVLYAMVRGRAPIVVHAMLTVPVTVDFFLAAWDRVLVRRRLATQSVAVVTDPATVPTSSGPPEGAADIEGTETDRGCAALGAGTWPAGQVAAEGTGCQPLPVSAGRARARRGDAPPLAGPASCGRRRRRGSVFLWWRTPFTADARDWRDAMSRPCGRGLTRAVFGRARGCGRPTAAFRGAGGVLWRSLTSRPGAPAPAPLRFVEAGRDRYTGPARVEALRPDAERGKRRRSSDGIIGMIMLTRGADDGPPHRPARRMSFQQDVEGRRQACLALRIISLWEHHAWLRRKLGPLGCWSSAGRWCGGGRGACHSASAVSTCARTRAVPVLKAMATSEGGTRPYRPAAASRAARLRPSPSSAVSETDFRRRRVLQPAGAQASQRTRTSGARRAVRGDVQSRWDWVSAGLTGTARSDRTLVTLLSPRS